MPPALGAEPRARGTEPGTRGTEPGARGTEAAGLEPFYHAVEGYRLTDLRRLLAAPLAPGRDSANRSYFEGKLAIAEYRHADADQLADRCARQARNDAERSRCAELAAEGVALAIALSGDDLARLGMISTLRAHLADAVRFDARNPHAQQLLARFYRVAPWFLGGGGAAATRAMRAAITLLPTRADEFLGIDAFDARHWIEAIAYLQRVVDRDPGRAAAAYYLALACDKANQRSRAIKVLAVVVAAHPEFWDAQFQLGTLSLDSDPRFAAQVLTRFSNAATPGPKRLANAWWRIGVAEESQGRPEAALKAYRTALRYKPGHNEAQAGVQRLSRAASH